MKNAAKFFLCYFNCPLLGPCPTFVYSTPNLQGDQLNIAVYIWYLEKSDLFSVRYCTRGHWTNHFIQDTRKTRPCLTGDPVFHALSTLSTVFIKEGGEHAPARLPEQGEGHGLPLLPLGPRPLLIARDLRYVPPVLGWENQIVPSSN